MLKVEDIRRKLLEHGFSEEELKGLKKKELIDHYNTALSTEALEENNLEETDELEAIFTEDDTENDTPSYLSSEWNDFVISQFSEDEITDGNPNVNGLRRVTEKLLGPILSSRPVWIDQKNGSPGHASCVYEISILWKRNEDGFVDIGDYGIRMFGAAAGSFEGNTDNEFALYPEAIAETRAEVRTLRKALRLHTVAAEEITNKAKLYIDLKGKQVEWNENDLADPIQTKTIKNKCDLLKIDLTKLVQSRGVEELDKLNKSQAADLIMLLNKYQTQNEQIPEEFKC